MVSKIIGVIAASAVVVTLGCWGGSSAFRTGHKAEMHKDYDTALVEYGKALQSEPDNASYVLHEKVARIQASLFHLKQGRRFAADGRPDDAAGEFQKAASIDPTNQAAAQELARLLAAQAEAKRARETAIKDALKQRDEPRDSGVVKLKPLPTEPVSHFHLSSDSRRVFETLCKLAQLNVAFTSDFQPRPVSIDLANVSVEDALRVVSYQTKSFWKPITSNTILVIPDTPNNRKDYEEEVLKTVYLQNPLLAADRTAIVTALRTLLTIKGAMENPDSNAIILKDTPEKVDAAEKMIHDLDRGKAEVLIEVAVVEADFDRVRDLGLRQVWPQNSLGLKDPNIAGTALNNRLGTTGTVSIKDLHRLGAGDFSVAIPAAVANALLSDNHTRILQNPEVRVTDGAKATLKIGSRFPFATGSFLPSFGGVTGGTGGTTTGGNNFGLLASTQFQYQDIGVNMDITPHLLPDGEVALHDKIEISSVGASVSVGGLEQPTFGQRTMEHDIRLKEGEVNVLGGLIESTKRKGTTGVPGLSQVPILRYFTSTEHTERSDTEVLVMLTPRVIRLPEPPPGQARAVKLGSGAAAGSSPGAPMIVEPGVMPPTGPSEGFPQPSRPQPPGVTGPEGPYPGRPMPPPGTPPPPPGPPVRP